MCSRIFIGVFGVAFRPHWANTRLDARLRRDIVSSFAMVLAMDSDVGAFRRHVFTFFCTAFRVCSGSAMFSGCRTQFAPDNCMKRLGRLLLCFLLFVSVPEGPGLRADDEAEIRVPTRIVGIRAFGGRDETLPPIVQLDTRAGQYGVPLSSDVITIEIDAASDLTPSLYVQFVHCDAFWNESDNIFLNDQSLRTSNIDWYQGAQHSAYFTHRGTLQVPGLQIRFEYSGNWKAKVFDYDNPEAVLAECRFFVVEGRTRCEMGISTDFYNPQAPVSPIAHQLDAEVTTPSNMFDDRLHSVVFYRNHRWFEPMIVNADNAFSFFPRRPEGSRRKTSVFGFAGAVKRFSIREVPTENAYRILDLTNTARYPVSSEPLQSPFSDLRRNGDYFENDDDGALVTRNVFGSYDDYVPYEFIFDPEGTPTRLDLYVAGSFNNWRVTPEWQLHYDEESRLYRLRQWVRRGRHNYMYATGDLDVDSGHVDELNFEEYEGNTQSAGHTYMAFVYYREPGFGGYDALVGLGAANVFGTVR